MVPILAPTGEPGTVHLAILDESGDSAIFEYIEGKLVIHHGRQYQVMTNSPIFSEPIPGQPNIADTLWLTVSDQKNKVYYYQDTNSPSILWAKLNRLDFSEGSGSRKLQLDGNPDIAGDQTNNFKPAEPFKFLAPHD